MALSPLLPATPAQAITGTGLLAHAFLGASWDRWRAVLKAAYAEPLTDEELALFREVAERDPPVRQVRELWAVCGRWSGKDSIASAIACVTALRDWRKHLRPGERASVVCLACDRDQARIVHGYIRGYFETIELLRPLLVRMSDELLELANGVDIVVSTNSYRSVRGRTVVCAILDECAFYRDERSATPDSELYAALVPALVRVPGTMLIGISTPYRRSGLLYNQTQRHYGKNGDVLVVRGATPLFNPLAPQRIIDEALREDREKAGSEWLALWRSDLADFLDRELVDAAIDPGVIVRPPGQRTYFAFCDPSGGRGDSFACAIVHIEGDRIVLDLLYERLAPFDPADVVRELAEILRGYAIATVTGDRYAAEWVVSGFAKVGIRYQQSERDRSALYLDALPLFTSGRVRLLDDARLVHQLTTLERRVTPFGRDRVGHPERSGMHDDAANACCGALALAASDARPALLKPADLLCDGEPAPLPIVCDAVYAVFALDETGRAATVYASLSPFLPPPLRLIDFDLNGITSQLWADTAERLRELARTCRARKGAFLFVPQALLPSARAQGVPAMAIPEQFDDPAEVAIAAAGYVASGAVKMTQEVNDKSQSMPFRGAFDFRGGDMVDPLRCAAVLAVVMGLEDQRATRRAA
jgi:hypothetical protein